MSEWIKGETLHPASPGGSWGRTQIRLHAWDLEKTKVRICFEKLGGGSGGIPLKFERRRCETGRRSPSEKVICGRTKDKLPISSKGDKAQGLCPLRKGKTARINCFERRKIRKRGEGKA